MDTQAINRACELIGSKRRLATLLGVTPPTVQEWTTGERKVPALRCPQIEKLVGGKVRCEELRPDLADHWLCLRNDKPRRAKREAA